MALLNPIVACPRDTVFFLTFVEPLAAQVFFQEHLSKALVVNGTHIPIGWAYSSRISNFIKMQIEGGASRNVYLGNLTEKDTEDTIRSALHQIEHIRFIRNLNTAFVYFLSIQAASKCVINLQADDVWTGKKIGYGKDYCADLAEQYNQALYGKHAFRNLAAEALSFRDAQGIPSIMKTKAPAPPLCNVRRTIYVGNIHEDATTEDLCNVFRGGNLIQIQFLKCRKTAFVTSMDTDTAENVYDHATAIGIHIRGKKLRLGWGKNSWIFAQVALAVQNGATRNIYVGGIDLDVMTVPKLKEDFSDYGEIELVNIHKEKKRAFINFTSIKSAMTAINGIRLNPDYVDLKISYGKDRCGNLWKPVKVNASKKTKE